MDSSPRPPRRFSRWKTTKRAFVLDGVVHKPASPKKVVTEDKEKSETVKGKTEATNEKTNDKINKTHLKQLNTESGKTKTKQGLASVAKPTVARKLCLDTSKIASNQAQETTITSNVIPSVQKTLNSDHITANNVSRRNGLSHKVSVKKSEKLAVGDLSLSQELLQKEKGQEDVNDEVTHPSSKHALSAISQNRSADMPAIVQSDSPQICARSSGNSVHEAADTVADEIGRRKRSAVDEESSDNSRSDKENKSKDSAKGDVPPVKKSKQDEAPQNIFLSADQHSAENVNISTKNHKNKNNVSSSRRTSLRNRDLLTSADTLMKSRQYPLHLIPKRNRRMTDESSEKSAEKTNSDFTLLASDLSLAKTSSTNTSQRSKQSSVKKSSAETSQRRNKSSTKVNSITAFEEWDNSVQSKNASKSHASEKSLFKTNRPNASQVGDNISEKNICTNTSQVGENSSVKTNHPNIAQSDEKSSLKTNHPNTSPAGEKSLLKTNHPNTSQASEKSVFKKIRSNTSKENEKSSLKANHPNTSHLGEKSSLKGNHANTSQAGKKSSVKSNHSSISQASEKILMKTNCPNTPQAVEKSSMKTTANTLEANKKYSIKNPSKKHTTADKQDTSISSQETSLSSGKGRSLRDRSLLPTPIQMQQTRQYPIAFFFGRQTSVNINGSLISHQEATASKKQKVLTQSKESLLSSDKINSNISSKKNIQSKSASSGKCSSSSSDDFLVPPMRKKHKYKDNQKTVAQNQLGDAAILSKLAFPSLSKARSSVDKHTFTPSGGRSNISCDIETTNNSFQLAETFEETKKKQPRKIASKKHKATKPSPEVKKAEILGNKQVPKTGPSPSSNDTIVASQKQPRKRKLIEELDKAENFVNKEVDSHEVFLWSEDGKSRRRSDVTAFDVILQAVVDVQDKLLDEIEDDTGHRLVRKVLDKLKRRIKSMIGKVTDVKDLQHEIRQQNDRIRKLMADIKEQQRKTAELRSKMPIKTESDPKITMVRVGEFMKGYSKLMQTYANRNT